MPHLVWCRCGPKYSVIFLGGACISLVDSTLTISTITLHILTFNRKSLLLETFCSSCKVYNGLAGL